MSTNQLLDHFTEMTSAILHVLRMITWAEKNIHATLKKKKFHSKTMNLLTYKLGTKCYLQQILKIFGIPTSIKERETALHYVLISNHEQNPQLHITATKAQHSSILSNLQNDPHYKHLSLNIKIISTFLFNNFQNKQSIPFVLMKKASDLGISFSRY